MERPTWKNTLFSGHAIHSLDGFASTARSLGYPYIEWNERILSSDRVNGMHKIGAAADLPVCTAKELDQPGGVQWHGGLRPILQDIRSMAHDTLRAGTTLLEIVSGRVSKALETVMLNGDAAAGISSTLTALDDCSLRGTDIDGSIAVAVAALRVRVAAALDLCGAAESSHRHEWEVYSTSLADVCIMVRCGCGAFGNVPNERFGHTDWSRAFHAPSSPYPLREGLVAEVVAGRSYLPHDAQPVRA